ncbi:acyltransferase [Streptomyces flavofungini]|uniref:acyltransferase n=1 Tax=Streptomyces flavofungini TaxID=68200 RepID=UPI0025B1E6A0|nr:acyltransferase [Streptomyces flavofungini]WJV51824.1 acyltransferase [Streptomyces flavofungini]WJV51827.1 acyltransferase [Streptomyces flavofungini]
MMSTEELLRLTVTALMTRAGERQATLAEGIGLAQAQVSRKQTGKAHWTLDDCDQLAAHYGMSVLDLLAGPTHAVTALPADRGPAQASLPLAAPPTAPAPKPVSVPRSEALSGPCVLCGQTATDAVEGIWQHLTSQECAEALDEAAPLDDHPEDEDQEEYAPTGPGEPATPYRGDPQPGPAVAEGSSPVPAPAVEDPRPTAVRAPGYASGTLVDQIHARVRDVLNGAQGDIEAAQAALIKTAIPDVMALFDRSRVGGRYAHSKFPPTDSILRKKSQKGADEIWEGRPKWRNKTVLDAVKKGERIGVTALDMNAAYLAAFKCWLPVGKLVEDTTGVHDPKRSGVYQITPPAWDHKDLPNPLGARKEPGPVWVPDSLVRLLLDCAGPKWNLCDPPQIHRAMLSGATENLLEKLRRALAESRDTAITENDEVAVEYVKSMYSKFVSTIGESSANTDIRRPDWMHIIRSKAFTNLWRKAYKAKNAGLTVVEISGTDELHVAGDWRPVFPEGRALSQVKVKNLYTLGGER